MGVQNWFVAAYLTLTNGFKQIMLKFKDEANNIFEANQVDDAIPHAFYRLAIDAI
jgi:hypothetical protein